MNQVIFANGNYAQLSNLIGHPFGIAFTPVSNVGEGNISGASVTDKPNEDFIIHYMTPSKTFKTIEVNRETLSIQKINLLDESFGGEYHYEITIENSNLGENPAVQIIRQDAVPHQRNSWYIELDANNPVNSFWNQLQILSKSNLLGIERIERPEIDGKYPLTFKFIDNPNSAIDFVANIKSPYQYLQMLLTKHVQNFGYNHTDDNAELNSGLTDYKAWIAGTENDATVAVYRLRFATNRKASKTRDERVWQNVYICTKGENNSVASLLDAYIAILNGETTNEGGGE